MYYVNFVLLQEQTCKINICLFQRINMDFPSRLKSTTRLPQSQNQQYKTEYQVVINPSVYLSGFFFIRFVAYLLSMKLNRFLLLIKQDIYTLKKNVFKNKYMITFCLE